MIHAKHRSPTRLLFGWRLRGHASDRRFRRGELVSAVLDAGGDAEESCAGLADVALQFPGGFCRRPSSGSPWALRLGRCGPGDDGIDGRDPARAGDGRLQRDLARCARFRSRADCRVPASARLRGGHSAWPCRSEGFRATAMAWRRVARSARRGAQEICLADRVVLCRAVRRELGYAARTGRHGAGRSGRRLPTGSPARGAGRVRRPGAALRSWLPAARLPVALAQSAHRRLRRRSGQPERTRGPWRVSAWMRSRARAVASSLPRGRCCRRVRLASRCLSPSRCAAKPASRPLRLE